MDSVSIAMESLLLLKEQVLFLLRGRESHLLHSSSDLEGPGNQGLTLLQERILGKQEKKKKISTFKAKPKGPEDQ